MIKLSLRLSDKFPPLVSSSNCCVVTFCFLGFGCYFLDTSSAPAKPSRPGPSRQLQRWPENRGGRMKRGGNSWKHTQSSTFIVIKKKGKKEHGWLVSCHQLVAT